MTFEQWWTSDENRWSDTRYVKKVAEMAWEAAIAAHIPTLTSDMVDEIAAKVVDALKAYDVDDILSR